MPRTLSWEILSLPTGLIRDAKPTQDYVLGYPQPSLRDCRDGKPTPNLCPGVFPIEGYDLQVVRKERNIYQL
jgi:hypothetical protein